MEPFVSSSSIEAFPAALRNLGTGKYTTEDNLATIFRAAAGKESFVVNSSPLEFVIHGHYFKWTGSLTSGDTNLTAYIVEDSSTKTLRNVDGSTTLDDSGNFKGVTFSLPTPSGSGLSIYSLQITDADGKLINEIPRLSAITVGTGLSTGATGGVITSTGSIFMPAIDYNGTTIAGSYGPSNNNKNEKSYEAAYNGVLRIPEITVDSYGKVIKANTYSWPISNTHYVSHISAASYVRPLLLGASAASYGENFNGTIAQTVYYNSSVKIDMTGTSAVLIAPTFSGKLSGIATGANRVLQISGNTNTFRPLLLGGLSTNNSEQWDYGTGGNIQRSVYFSSGIFVNENTGALYAKKFVGEFEGTITTVAETAKFYNGNITDAYRALIFASINAEATGTANTSLWYTTNIYTNPSKGYVYANRFIGPAASLTITTAGGNGKMLMWREGKPTETTHDAGNISQPVYMSSGTITALTATVGATNKPVYMNAGTITALTTTKGSFDTTNQKAQAVYFNNGAITAGQTIYWSTAAATGGAIGDIWIQYKN